MPLLDELVAEHGEHYRRLIEDALGWADTRPWLFDMDSREFVAELVAKSKGRAAEWGTPTDGPKSPAAGGTGGGTGSGTGPASAGGTAGSTASG